MNCYSCGGSLPIRAFTGYTKDGHLLCQRCWIDYRSYLQRHRSINPDYEAKNFGPESSFFEAVRDVTDEEELKLWPEWAREGLRTGRLTTITLHGKKPFKLDMDAQKFDDSKNPLDLLPTEALEQVGLVLQHGAKKYAAHNWRKGMRWSRLIAALLRHIFAFMRGEDNDPESGLSHMAHAGCCVLFLLNYQVTKEGEDDRYKIGEKS